MLNAFVCFLLIVCYFVGPYHYKLCFLWTPLILHNTLNSCNSCDLVILGESEIKIVLVNKLFLSVEQKNVR